MAIKGVLFDKDGTLIEVNGTWVPLYRQMLTVDFGVSGDEAEAMLIRGGYEPATGVFRAGSTLAAGTTSQLVQLWWPQLSTQEQKQRTSMIDNDIAPQAKEFIKPLMVLSHVFDELREMGLRLGIATNDSHRSAHAQMGHLEVHHYFEHIIGADSVVIPKPSGHMIELFCEKTGLLPEEVAMVGDNGHDMEEARAGKAGLAVAVLTGNSAHEDIAHMADHTLSSVAELPALLRGL
ncbi:MAG: HAD family hydrolase [Phyllobacteriaceae bacterium]|nr:HAD family hydrolase [Phyllobacteriaceae bacterium]